MEDYEIALEKLRGTEIDMIELNISCPNVKQGEWLLELNLK